MTFQSARVVIEVIAGLLPGKNPDPQFTKRFTITSEEWEDASPADNDAEDNRMTLLEARNREAQEYALQLMMAPHRLNWVRTDWIWL